jgi:hypothetical protein
MAELQDEFRCENCPMRVVPTTRLARLVFGITHGVKLPGLPRPEALKACSGSPDLDVGEFYGTDTLGFSYSGQSVSGTCIAEGVHVESNTAEARNQLNVVSVTNN